MTSRNRVFARLGILLTLAVTVAVGASVYSARNARAASARTSVATPTGPEQLGTVQFPTSCNATAQPLMVSGVAALHSFQYPQSAAIFQKAAEADSHCAMAKWGEAMSLYHQLWDNADASALEKGRADLAAAQKISPVTPREKGYITAAAEYFQKGPASPALSYTQRTEAYSNAMKALAQANPNDVDAQAFYALSLVSLSYKEKDGLPYRQQALAILQPMLITQPNHPGVAHYIIHAADTPALAPQGLDAARKYAQIAPDSAHALHMPSHIFTRLGLWQESIDSNIAAAAAAERAGQKHEEPAHYQFHAMDFLAYSYLQTGQASETQRVIAGLKSVPNSEVDETAYDQSYFAARTALDLHHFHDAAALPVPDLPLKSQDAAYWARTIGSARTGDAAAAKANLVKLREALAARDKSDVEMGCDMHSGKHTAELEAEGWVAYAEGRTDDAIASLKEAAKTQEAEHLESLFIPAREMLADLLMELKRPADALQEYEAALKVAPNRFDGLLGASIAAKANGDEKTSAEYATKLHSNCPPSADREEIRQVQALLTQK